MTVFFLVVLSSFFEKFTLSFFTIKILLFFFVSTFVWSVRVDVITENAPSPLIIASEAELVEYAAVD